MLRWLTLRRSISRRATTTEALTCSQRSSSSDSGKQNGLYWEPAEGQPKSPLGPLAAFATNEGYSLRPDSHVPFHGYFFHMLTSQGANVPGGAKDFVVNGKMTGGFAFVAYPAEYRNSAR